MDAEELLPLEDDLGYFDEFFSEDLMDLGEEPLPFAPREDVAARVASLSVISADSGPLPGSVVPASMKREEVDDLPAPSAEEARANRQRRAEIRKQQRLAERGRGPSNRGRSTPPLREPLSARSSPDRAVKVKVEEGAAAEKGSERVRAGPKEPAPGAGEPAPGAGEPAPGAEAPADDKEAKKQRRLLRNRMSAQLHRERKRAQVKDLQERLKERDAEIAGLRSELALALAARRRAEAALVSYGLPVPESPSDSEATSNASEGSSALSDSDGNSAICSRGTTPPASPKASPARAEPMEGLAALDGGPRKRRRGEGGGGGGSFAARSVALSMLGVVTLVAVLSLDSQLPPTGAPPGAMRALAPSAANATAPLLAPAAEAFGPKDAAPKALDPKDSFALALQESGGREVVAMGGKGAAPQAHARRLQSLEEVGRLALVPKSFAASDAECEEAPCDARLTFDPWNYRTAMELRVQTLEEAMARQMRRKQRYGAAGALLSHEQFWDDAPEHLFGASDGDAADREAQGGFGLRNETHFANGTALPQPRLRGARRPRPKRDPVEEPLHLTISMCFEMDFLMKDTGLELVPVVDTPPSKDLVTL